MSKRLAKQIWWLHSWLGLICGLGLVVIAATGSLLVFHEELDTWRFPELYRVHPTVSGRLSYDTLWSDLRRALPEEKITGWAPACEAGKTDAIYLSRSGEEEAPSVHLDPSTGHVLGVPVRSERTLTGWLLELHYSFFAGTTGLLVAGLLAVGLLMLGSSGVWLYRDFWRHFFTLRWGRSARLFCSDLHKMIGITSTGFNLILGFTGAWWNLNSVWSQWTAKSAPDPAPSLQAARPFHFAAEGLSLDAMVARASHELPGFGLVYLALPTENAGAVTLFGTVPTANPLRGDYGSHLTFKVPGGELIQVVDIRNAGVWGKISDSFALLHYGTFGAVFGRVADLCIKALWTLLGLFPGVLAVSGFVVWRSRQSRLKSSDFGRMSLSSSEPGTARSRKWADASERVAHSDDQA